MEEETGYVTEIMKEIKLKVGMLEGFRVEVHYFFVKVIGGEREIQDPDQLIYDIDWKTIDELNELHLSFPEDREFLIDCIKNNYSHNS